MWEGEDDRTSGVNGVTLGWVRGRGKTTGQICVWVCVVMVGVESEVDELFEALA